MKVHTAFLADEANISQEGRLNVLGIFDRLASLAWPLAVPKMVFVFRLHAEPGDSQRTYPLRVRLLDDAGNALFEASGEMSAGRVEPGEFLASNHVFALVRVAFPRPGLYRFVVGIGAFEEHETPLLLVSPATDSSFN